MKKKILPVNTPFDYSTLATDILNKRTSEGITLREMSETISIPIGTCHRAEAIATKLDIETIIPICNWLGKPLQNYLTPKIVKNGKAKAIKS